MTDNVGSNFFLDLMNAQNKNQETMDAQATADRETVENMMQLQEMMYQSWNTALKRVVNPGLDGLTACQELLRSLGFKDWQQSGYEFWLKGLAFPETQAVFNQTNAEAQSAEAQVEGVVSAAQGQVGADASNLQNQAATTTRVLQIGDALADNLGKV